MDATPMRGDQLSTRVPPWQESARLPVDKSSEVALYDRMFREDPQARQALSYLSNLVISLIGEYQHEDEAIQQWVREALRGMRGDYTETLRWLLRGVLFGYAVSEKIWAQQEHAGRLGWGYDALIPVVPTSISYGGIVIEQALGQPSEVVQWRQYGEGAAIHIPGEKVVHWSYEDTGDGYGTPVGRNILALYEGKAEALGMWRTGVRRLGQPMLYEKIPNTSARGSGEYSSDEKTYAETVIDAWKSSAGGSVHVRPVALDWAPLGLPSIEVIRADAWDEQFINYIDYVNRAYMLAFGIPSLVLMESSSTAQAQSIVHTDAARLGALPLAQQFTEACLMRDLVRPLVDVNFGAQDDYGSFPVAVPIDEAYLANLLTSLASSGVLGMMVPERVYMQIQELLPQVLPKLEPTEYAEPAVVRTTEPVGHDQTQEPVVPQ